MCLGHDGGLPRARSSPQRVGLDPAVLSAPMIATLVDATGLLIYFTIAKSILRL